MDEQIEFITQVGLDQKKESNNGRPILISAFTITAIKSQHVIHLSIFYPLFPHGVVGEGAAAYMHTQLQKTEKPWRCFVKKPGLISTLKQD